MKSIEQEIEDAAQRLAEAIYPVHGRSSMRVRTNFRGALSTAIRRVVETHGKSTPAEDRAFEQLEDGMAANPSPMSAARFDAIVEDLCREVSGGADSEEVRSRLHRALARWYVREEPKCPLVMTPEGYELLMEAMAGVANDAHNHGLVQELTRADAERRLREHFDVTVAEGGIDG